MSISDWLLDPSGLTPHGFCLSWAPGLVGLHVVADVLTGLAYFSIPLALAALVKKRPDFEYRGVAYLFVAFILACGTTHLMAVYTLWVPAYGVEGLIKALTAALSIATAISLWPLIPRVAALPSPAQLKALNGRLTLALEEQTRTTALLRLRDTEIQTANQLLEQRVAERTAQLVESNRLLTDALVERGEAQTALARSEAEFRASFEAAAVGKTQTDPHTGRIVRANSAFARMLGYEPEELIGRNGWEFTWPEDLVGDKAEYQRVLDGEISAYVREQRFLHRSGEPLWGRTSAAIVRDAISGQPYLTVAVVEDIDERHRALTALNAARQALEDMVQQRTEALAQRDLLLREVYHRVKNNLQIVDSLLVMQARKLSDPEAREALRGLRSRIFALGLVHHQLMGSVDLSTFDVASFLGELVTNLLDAGAQSGVTMAVEAAPLAVGLDFAIPLGLLVTELVTNCLKHAFPSGSGHVRVELSEAADGGVLLVVADNGQGVKSSDPAEGDQNGLGSRIIAGLVAQLGGRLTVIQSAGRHTEIRFPPLGLK